MQTYIVRVIPCNRCVLMFEDELQRGPCSVPTHGRWKIPDSAAFTSRAGNIISDLDTFPWTDCA